ncbi:MAG: ATP-dependent helicase [Nitrospirae bacterium]|nr:ATP-dependent helicase [Nitrospirota bacterium]
MQNDRGEGVWDDLNPEQREAVEHGEGPLLIIAGAGTGKTKVLTYRIAHLLLSGRARPEEVLALTFTEKAAAEMEERVDTLVPLGMFGCQIGTFHAFGDRLLREHGLLLGLTTDCRVLSRAEQVLFCRERLFDLPLRRLRPLGNPTKQLEAILTLISRAKDEAVTPEEYRAYAESLPSEGAGEDEDAELHRELAEVYARYQELMARAGHVDYGDQILLALRLLREHPSVLQRCGRQVKYILVDEFQDTNYAQFQLVRLLAGDRGNLTVVGDDDQSIYKFRGAALSNILTFMDHFPEARRVVLTRNYRSRQAILDGAYRLIRYNNPDRLEARLGIEKRLVEEPSKVQSPKSNRTPQTSDLGPRTSDPPPEEGAIRPLAFDTGSSEAEGVAERIAERVKQGGCCYGDFAVLVRANDDAEPFLRALFARGIPYRFTGNRGLYGREEIRLLWAFLKAVADPRDSLSLYQLAVSDLYRLPMTDLALAMHRASRRHRPLYQVLREISQGSDGTDELSDPPSAEGLAAFRSLLGDLERWLELSRTLPTSRLLYQFLQEKGILARLTEAATPEAERQVQNIARFFEVIRECESLTQRDRIGPCLEQLAALREAGDDPAAAEADPDEDAVQVLTVHQAKGLEFRVVFLVCLVQQKFPTRRRGDPFELPGALIKEKLPSGDFHIQEERRLFYVGMTRAREELYLTWAADYGTKRQRKVSPFVQEAVELGEEAVRPWKGSPLERIGRFAPAPPPGSGTDVGEWAPSPLSEEAILTLSYYQIDDYLTCPLKYRYSHVLRIPCFRHHAVVYGSAVHAAVQALLKSRQAGRPLPLPELLAVFDRAWVSEGFLSADHEAARMAEGRQMLARFWEIESASPVVPAAVEQEFAFLLQKNRVVGRWDRLDERDGEAVIIDYKTSQIRDQEKADAEIKKSLQLGIYAMGYRAITGRLPERVELRFLEAGLTASLQKTARDLAETEAQVLKAAAGIRARDYAPRPDYLACKFCTFRTLCPHTAG